MKLLRKLGIPAIALAGMLALFSPSSADAKVRFGVQIGVPPVYTYPYPYYSPYYSPYYAYPYSYGYYGPYATWGPSYHYYHHWDHERWEHRHHHR
jgi:hypothetical protein